MLLKYLIVAFVQGITEPLPVSSSGHMLITEKLLNLNNINLNYEIICNFGSFIAILIIFWKDIIKLISDFFKFIFKKDNKAKKGFLYCIYIVISTLPICITGLLLKDYFEEHLGGTVFLGIAFIITSLALFLVRNFNGKKKDFDITLKDAIIIGLFEAITFIPGISRSGTVLVGCLLCGLNRDTALKYTFILYFPVSVGSMILGISDMISDPNISSLLLPFSLGLITAGIITYLSYRYLTEFVRKGKLIYFSVYCLLLAFTILLFF